MSDRGAALHKAGLTERLANFRRENAAWMQQRQKYKPDPKLERILERGWLLPYLLHADTLTWQRWEYWTELMEAGEVGDRPIPQIEWTTDGTGRTLFDQQGHKHLEHCFDLIPNDGHGGWAGWSSWTYVDYFFDWLLFGFGQRGYDLPTEPRGCEGASMRLYQAFNLNLLMAFPNDYLGDILAINQFGKRSGFYPTPLTVCTMMTRMLMQGQDCRRETVCDPCLGTGRFLLTASNYSLRLYGQDINETVIKAALINGYLYAPWMVKPFPFLDRELVEGDRLVEDKAGQPATVSQVVSESLTAAATGQPDAVEYLAETEHDSENQWKFEPIKKRRKKGSEDVLQGQLF
jgi:hypothetical protein